MTEDVQSDDFARTGDGDDDDIDGRAARLLAQVAAQRRKQQEPEPESVAESTPALPSSTSSDEPTPDSPGRHRSARRMAAPPWQTGSPATVVRPQVTESEESQPQPTTPPHAFPAPPPGWPPALPMPMRGWQAPPPGWPAELPPLPPPGWQPPARTRPPTQFRGRRSRQSAQSATHSAALPEYPASQALLVPPSLNEAEICHRDPQAPQSGWRRAVHTMTGGRINPGISRADRDHSDLLQQIRHPIVGDFRIAVLSIKGGVGKTTTTMGLGSALATVRTDRVIAVDANPDGGTLAERVLDTSTTSTVRDLLRDPHVARYADVRNHTRMATSRLEVLASEQDPAVAEVFGEADYRRTMDILRRYYNIILTDCGTGIMHSAMAGVLDLADAIVLVSSPAIDAARSASATLDWLSQHGHGDLAHRAHVVFSTSQPISGALDLDKVLEHFEPRCGSLHVVPFERHLAEGADFDYALLKSATTRAYLKLAGAVSEQFAGR
jgi:MinD-like ATPase involved in chromosome partitioning or flagellar assembly